MFHDTFHIIHLDASLQFVCRERSHRVCVLISVMNYKELLHQKGRPGWSDSSSAAINQEDFLYFSRLHLVSPLARVIIHPSINPRVTVWYSYSVGGKREFKRDKQEGTLHRTKAEKDSFPVSVTNLNLVSRFWVQTRCIVLNCECSLCKEISQISSLISAEQRCCDDANVTCFALKWTDNKMTHSSVIQTVTNTRITVQFFRIWARGIRGTNSVSESGETCCEVAKVQMQCVVPLWLILCSVSVGYCD